MMRWLLAFALFLVPSLGVAQATSVSGRLHVMWDTDRFGRGAQFFVVPTSGGPAIRLQQVSAAQADRLIDLDRELVQASVLRQGAPAAGEQRAQLLSISLAAAEAHTEQLEEEAPQNAYNFVTLLCRFADDPRTPFTATSLAIPHGSSFPGLQYHYREMSGFPGIMAGSRIRGWYDLPFPRWQYVDEGGTRFGRLAEDCTQAADADVNFADFYGINLQVNGALSTRPVAPYDTLSFGGSWSLNLDGQSRAFGITSLSSAHASNYVVLHHEVGHALGWPHSSGDYGQEYDSRWDLMSAGYITFENPWGWRGPHTIMPHRQAAGWIAPDRIFWPARGTRTQVRLARAALSPAVGYQMIAHPTSMFGRYVVEARIPAGLDVGFPGSAVLIHSVFGPVRSYVVDPDRNGNPNDEGAMWRPGETFADSITGLALTVDAGDATGFDVTVVAGWELSVNHVGRGTVSIAADGETPELCQSGCARIFGIRGTEVSLEAVPDSGRQFAGWTGDCSGKGVCNLMMLGGRYVGAIFAAPPTVLTTALAAGVMGASYSGKLEATAEQGVTTWFLRDGGLPTGLTLGTQNGTIVGVPEVSGVFSVTVVATSFGLEAEQQLTLEIVRPELALDAVIDEVVGLGTLSPDVRRFLDLVGNRNGRVDVGDVRAWLVDAGYLSPAQRAEALQRLPAAPRTP